jgi:hypothetical protein
MEAKETAPHNSRQRSSSQSNPAFQSLENAYVAPFQFATLAAVVLELHVAPGLGWIALSRRFLARVTNNKVFVIAAGVAQRNWRNARLSLDS